MDESILPDFPSVATNVTTIMLAERIGASCPLSIHPEILTK
jgi:hypothetical protein